MCRSNGDSRWRRAGKSVLRILLMLLILLGVSAVCYWGWQPGAEIRPGNFIPQENAVWLGHGWLGADDWFSRNDRDPAGFRPEAQVEALMMRLRQARIGYGYTHLCPAQFDGAIAAYDDAQVERFLDAAERHGIRVLPWIGGVFGGSARVDNARWRANFVASVAELLARHPRIAGVQVNIEPLPSGNRDFLTLLEELRPVLSGRILGVAAYPPPTRWHPFPEVHWELDYLGEVAARCDQMAVMMYDTGIRLEKLYTQLMRQWSEELEQALAGYDCRLFYGVPAYEDAGVGYHDPTVEHLRSALAGIQAAPPARAASGYALYCEWEMTPEKWHLWRQAVADAGE